MDCNAARQYLSLFYDGELSPALTAELEEHISGCAHCTETLAGFRELSQAARKLETPVVPPLVWQKIEADLNRPQPRPHVVDRSRRGRRIAVLSAVAALLAIVLGIQAWRLSPSHAHAQMAADFSEYLDGLAVDPEKAERELREKYNGQEVSLEAAQSRVRYPVVAPPTLPDGQTREGIYLLQMPCCTCLQVVYKGKDGERLAVFEHVDSQPGWFGDRPSIRTHCDGVATSLVEVDKRLAASWQRQGCFITLVGAQDVKEVAQVIAFLDQVKPVDGPADIPN